MNYIGILLLLGLVIALCLFVNRLGDKFKIPSLLLFIGLGLLFGVIFRLTDLGNFTEYNLGNVVCSICLVFVIFFGGFGTNFKAAKPVLKQSIVLSLLGTLFTGLLTGLIVYGIFYILPFGKLTILEAFLIGGVISSTDAASVFDILRRRKLNLKYNTASMLEVESGSNDPMSYLLTVVFVSLLSVQYGLVDNNYAWYEIILMFISQIGFGILSGAIFGLGGAFILKRFSFSSSHGATLFILSLGLISYAIPSILPGLLMGNGYLGCYIAGLILGNSKIPDKRDSVRFFDTLTSVSQMIIFFLLGLLATPEWLISLKTLIPAILIFIALTLIVRPLTVFGLLSPFRSKINQMTLVSFGGLRGVASIVFATYAISTLGSENLPYDIFSIIFVIVICSLVLQGSLLPLTSKKLKMISPFENVLRTFNDYSDEKDISFVRLDITSDHAWCNKKIKDCVTPKDFLIVLIRHEGKFTVPNGNSIIQENDSLICCAPSFKYDQEGLDLKEVNIFKNSPYADKRLYECKLPKGELIVIIKRDGATIVPNGMSKIKENDTLVTLKIDSIEENNQED